MNTAQLPANADASDAAIPMMWIDRMFQRFAGMYGKHWLDMWVGMDLAGVKQIWAEDLAGLTPVEVKRGMDACGGRTFPPTLPEFRNLCKPVLTDTKKLLLVAMREMNNRQNRQLEQWPDARTFWAAQRVGRDLTRMSAEKLQIRFDLAWFESANDVNKPIPVATDSALPSPGETTLTQEEAKARAQQIGLQVGRADSARQWAFDIAKEPKQFGPASIEAAIKALKVFGTAISAPLIERAKELGLGDLVATEVAAS